MDVADKALVLKLMGMLRSNNENERLVALRKIETIGAKYKLNQTETIMAAGATDKAQNPPPNQSQPHYRRQQQPRPQPKPKPAAAPWDKDPFRKVRDFANERNENLRKLDQLWETEQASDFPLFNEWERSFISDVAARYTYDNELTDKQLIVVYKILKKAERCGVKWGGHEHGSE